MPTPPQSRLRRCIAFGLFVAASLLWVPVVSASETSRPLYLEMLGLRHGNRDIPLRLEDDSAAAPRSGSDQIHVRRYAPISLSDEEASLTLSFGSPPGGSRHAPRLRYQLVGYDSGWRNLDRAFMHLVLKFHDNNNIPISRTEFRVRGDSVGWTGNWDTSWLSNRSEEAAVPPRAALMSIWIDSGGHDENSGIMLIDDLRIHEITSSGPPALVFSEDFEEGYELGKAQGDFALWVRDGGALDGAIVHQGPPAAGGHALAIIDSNPVDYAAWRLKDQSLVRVRPGQKLKLDWREVYSVGLGRAGQATYPLLPSGQYQFRVQEVDAVGNPLGQELLVPVFIAPPFYRNVWFHASAVTALILVGFAVERAFARARMRRKLAVLERKQVVQQERERIARDIHDDLGSVLSRISMTSEIAALEASPGSNLQRRLCEICDASRQLTHTMEEIVWAQDPRHDSLDNTASYFSSFASDLLSVANIACRLDIPLDLPAIPLDAERRHDLFLVFKESLNNIIKHSAATEVLITMHWRDEAIFLSVADNGRGFDPELSKQHGKGNGLFNMGMRLQHVGGRVDIESQLGHGTLISIFLPVPKLVTP